MKTFFQYFVSTFALALSPLGLSGAEAQAAEWAVPAMDMAVAETGGNPPVAEEVSCRLTRVNVLVGAFAELDFKILSLKLKPYVELRFNRR